MVLVALVVPVQNNMVIDPSIFRAYDIRGIVDDNLTEETTFAVGKAYASLAREKAQQQTVIARDGRLSGPRLHQALSEGIRAGGIDVIDIGAVPTPVLYYATHALGTQSGLMLTGSHNPKNYNGIKMMLAGETLHTSAIKSLYQRINDDYTPSSPGSYISQNINDRYCNEVLQSTVCERRLKVVVDCGNGITGKLAPQLLRRLGCDVVELFCEVDGNFPNHHPDPSQTINLQDLINKVYREKADFGIAFDGDGDRLGLVTNKGKIIWPDRILMLYAKSILQHNANGSILFDVKCTKHLPELIKQLGGIPQMWKTGHSFMKEKLKSSNTLLAGEMSGHFFFNDRWYGFDDGIYAACRLIEILSKTEEDCDSIFQSFPDSINTPELKLPIADDIKFKFMQNLVEGSEISNANITTIDGLRVDFNDGWGLIRPSNTTPNLVLRFEADNQSALSRIKSLFCELILNADPTIRLPEHLTSK